VNTLETDEIADYKDEGWHPPPALAPTRLIRLSHPFDELTIAFAGDADSDPRWYEVSDDGWRALGLASLLDEADAIAIAEKLLNSRIADMPLSELCLLDEDLPDWGAHRFLGRGGYRVELSPAIFASTREQLGLSLRKLGDLMATVLNDEARLWGELTPEERKERPAASTYIRHEKPAAVFMRIRRFEAGEVKSLSTLDLGALARVVRDSIAAKAKAEPITVEHLS